MRGDSTVDYLRRRTFSHRNARYSFLVLLPDKLVLAYNFIVDVMFLSNLNRKVILLTLKGRFYETIKGGSSKEALKNVYFDSKT